ncbi:DUF3017 domain-containing protein [Streptomyces sp. NPDC088116]|uniref:DUF3017 domain-containing protein n=1 Tax=Streptomyces sp. NPDC088116 TaxID=3365825 RepID=UPI00380C2125
MGAGTSADDAARSRRAERAAAPQGAAAGSPVAGSPAVTVGAPEPTESEPTAPEPAAVDANANANAANANATNANVDVDGDGDSDSDAASVPDSAPDHADHDAPPTGTHEPDRRFSITQDTARPEGGGRAAPGEASAPARQWPLLSVLGTTALGLLVVGMHPFAEAFRIGTILIGVALIGGAVLRRVLPSVGMLAVRSRFTDMLTYGVLGVVIVLLSLMTQPDPWLEIPFLEDVVHSTVP